MVLDLSMKQEVRVRLCLVVPYLMKMYVAN